MKVFAKNSNNGSSSNSFIQRKGNETFFGAQTKLKVGKPNDKYEVEADSVADKVVAKTTQQNNSPLSTTPFISPSTSTQVQRMPFEEVQKKENSSEKSIAQTITPVIQLAPAEEETVQEKCAGCEEEKVQKMPFEEAQAKEEEEESAQMMEEEEAQTKEEEEESAQMMEEEEAQTKEEDEESAQMMEEEEAQTKEEDEESAQMMEDEEAQTKLATPKKPTKDIGGQIQSARGGGSPLPSQTKLQMESGFGADFSGVKIHTNPESVSMSKDMGAKAFTSKNDIFFNEGNFSPQSKEGQTLLAHELTHTIQQGASNPITQEETSQEANNLAPTSEGNNETATASSEIPSEEVTTEGGDIAIEENGEILAEDSENGEGTAKPEKASDENIATTPRSPEDDPNFQQLETRVATTSEDQSNHEEPQAVAVAAQGAALSPANERGSMAQAGQVDEMDNAEAGVITAESFKAQLMERIESMQLPATQEEAADFDDNNNIDEVNEAATQDVQNEQTAAAGPIEQTSQQEPNVDAVPEREITPLAEAPIGSAPPSVNPERAMPPARGEAEVSQPLQDNMAEVDNKMAENEVTDEQLANSNEPTFMAGLDAKGQAKENTENAPNALRQQEQGILQNAQINATTTSASGLETMHQDRNVALNQVNENQQQTGTTDTAERTRIAGEINIIYESAKTDVETLLGDLDTSVATIFTAGTKAAKAEFESYVERKMDAYKDRRYSGLRGAARWVGDKFSGLPDEVNEFFVEGREVYINYMDGVITEVAQLVADKLNEAKTRIATGKQEVQDYVTSLPENLQQIGQDAAEEISTKFDELEESVNSKQEELIDNLAQAYTDGLEAVDSRIEEMKAANRGLIDMALGAIMGIIETIINIKNMLSDLLAGALDAIGAIISDPIGFLSNLFSGVAQGFQNFGSNILAHLQTALIQWLTGTLGPVGITIPDDLFSLKGIFSLVAQILGLTWEFIRKKAVKLLGEPAVQALELGFEIFQVLKTGGIDGLWEYLKEQFNDLKETVIGAIKEMVITTVVEAGIKWILGLMNPASAFVKACMMIVDVVRFFIERGSQIIELVKAFTEGVKAVATGNVTAVAAAIENALARALPIVIGFLAALLGISGLARKVQKIIGKIRKRIDKAVDKIIKKARSAFKKLLKKGKAKVKGAVAGLLQWWKKKKSFRSKDGKSHKVYFKGSGENAQLTVASKPLQVVHYLAQNRQTLRERNPAIFDEAVTISEQLILHTRTAKRLNQEGDRAERSRITQVNNDIVTAIDRLSVLLSDLMVAGGVQQDPPPPDREYKASSQGAGYPKKAEVDYLTINTTSGGSPPGASNAGWPYIQHIGKTGMWVRMHLIAEKLGGPGTALNLVPGPSTVNAQMESFAENPLKTSLRQTSSSSAPAVSGQSVIFVETNVGYHSTPITLNGTNYYFANSVKVAGGLNYYNEAKSKWQRNPVSYRRTFSVPLPDNANQTVNLRTSTRNTILEINYGAYAPVINRGPVKTYLDQYRETFFSLRDQHSSFVSFRSAFLAQHNAQTAIWLMNYINNMLTRTDANGNNLAEWN